MSKKTDEKIKAPNFFQKGWTDPVGSKIISVVLISIFAIVYSFIKSIFEKISFKEAFYNTLHFQIELYILLIILFSIIIVSILVYFFIKKRKKTIGNFDTNQKVGSFHFREFYNALLSHKIEVYPEILGHKEFNLLQLFLLYQRPLNMGVEWESQDFLYYKLGPILMSYGLSEKIPTTNKLDSTGSEMIQTSKAGYEFLALLERWRVHNDVLSIEKEIMTNKKLRNEK